MSVMRGLGGLLIAVLLVFVALHASYRKSVAALFALQLLVLPAVALTALFGRSIHVVDATTIAVAFVIDYLVAAAVLTLVARWRREHTLRRSTSDAVGPGNTSQPNAGRANEL